MLYVKIHYNQLGFWNTMYMNICYFSSSVLIALCIICLFCPFEFKTTTFVGICVVTRGSKRLCGVVAATDRRMSDSRAPAAGWRSNAWVLAIINLGAVKTFDISYCIFDRATMSSVAGWLPLARASAVGWVPVARCPMPPSVHDTRPKCFVDRRLKLNVSGRRFETWQQTVEKYPDTLLGSVEKEFFYDSDADEYFFDRDPELFRHVLSYYRSGRIHLPKHVCFSAFHEELEFFGITGDAISDCCHEEFQDKYATYTLAASWFGNKGVLLFPLIFFLSEKMLFFQKY